MKKIFQIIKLFYIIYIRNPIKRFINYYIYGAYIPDNERNRQAFEYFLKVSEDLSIQPQTPVENFFEARIYEIWKKENKIEFIPYEIARPFICTYLISYMLEFKWVNDRFSK